MEREWQPEFLEVWNAMGNGDDISNLLGFESEDIKQYIARRMVYCFNKERRQR